MPLRYCTATTDEELAQILTLQQVNHASSLSEADAARDGFVTVMHSFELLRKMNHAAPQIIAKDGESVVGYALVMLKSHRFACRTMQPSRSSPVRSTSSRSRSGRSATCSNRDIAYGWKSRIRIRSSRARGGLT